MAQLKDTLVSGDLRVTGQIYGNAQSASTIEFIRGTQAASTYAWTGVTKDPVLYDGKTIEYFLPYVGNGSNVTLNLTLPDGTTTGAKNCYLDSTTRIVTQFPQNSHILLVYHKSLNISGTNYEGWWVSSKGLLSAVTSITITATSPIAIDSTAAITTTGTRTISHAASGVTAGGYGPTANVTIPNGGTFTVPQITVNATGHITSAAARVYTLPTSTDTKNTAGATDTSSKIFLVGATTQTANPQTYSDNQVYATNGQLDANKVRVAEAATLEYNSTTGSLNFVF